MSRRELDPTRAAVENGGHGPALWRHVVPATRQPTWQPGGRILRPSPPTVCYPHTQAHREDDLAFRPEPADAVIEAADIDGFFGSSLDTVLRGWGCTHVASAGFGLEGPVPRP